MADIKLYNLKPGKAKEIHGSDFKYEREIQKLCEVNMEVFFGIRFLASEHSTGNKHKGRIDSLGLDENNCPVIIEYKLDSKENVINQGLFYLDWLMDHQADFELLCMRELKKSEIEIDWSNPRLLCIARDFTRYDDYAIAQINRNIELIRYRLFDDDHIIFELASSVQGSTVVAAPSAEKAQHYRNMDDALKAASKDLLAFYKEFEDYLFSLGDDVSKKELKYYHAFTRIKNFVCVEVKTKKKQLMLFLKVDYNSIKDPTPNMRNVSNVGHYGTGDTEITISDLEELEAIKPLIERSYTES